MASDHLLRTEVGPGGGVGTIVDSAGFMRLRAQRWQVTDEPDDFPGIAARSATDLDPREVLAPIPPSPRPCTWGTVRKIFETDPATGKEILWLLAADSWASVTDGQVRQWVWLDGPHQHHLGLSHATGRGPHRGRCAGARLAPRHLRSRT